MHLHCRLFYLKLYYRTHFVAALCLPDAVLLRHNARRAQRVEHGLQGKRCLLYTSCILRCGKEAWRSANAIVTVLRQGLKKAGLPETAVGLIEDTVAYFIVIRNSRQNDAFLQAMAVTYVQ